MLTSVGPDSCAGGESVSLEATSSGSLLASHYLYSPHYHHTCPLVIHAAERGRQISVRLLDFQRRAPGTAPGGTDYSPHRLPLCIKHATIIDDSATFTMSSCGSGNRTTARFVSKHEQLKLFPENPRDGDVAFFFVVKG